MKIILKEGVYNKIRGIIKESIPLYSFQMKDTLNPDIFDENNDMHSEVRKKLLATGKRFYEYLGVDWVELKDITLTGSLANYNWSKFSDVDLHIIIPYEDISKKHELVDEFTWSKKELWNSEHDIKIKNYDVELYAQDVKGGLVAGGIYSILYDKWIKRPEKEDVNIDKDKVTKIVKGIDKEIDALVRKYLGGDCYGLTGDIKLLKNKISTLRKRGLADGGEFSSENIAFKSLRRMGSLDKLDKMKNDLVDNSLSVDKSREEKYNSGELKKIKKKNKQEKKNKPKQKGEDTPKYMIQGKRYASFRDAEKETGIAKSTIEYRVNSTNSDYNDYKKL